MTLPTGDDPNVPMDIVIRHKSKEEQAAQISMENGRVDNMWFRTSRGSMKPVPPPEESGVKGTFRKIFGGGSEK